MGAMGVTPNMGPPPPNVGVGFIAKAGGVIMLAVAEAKTDSCPAPSGKFNEATFAMVGTGIPKPTPTPKPKGEGIIMLTAAGGNGGGGTYGNGGMPSAKPKPCRLVVGCATVAPTEPTTPSFTLVVVVVVAAALVTAATAKALALASTWSCVVCSGDVAMVPSRQRTTSTRLRQATVDSDAVVDPPPPPPPLLHART